MKIFTNTYIPYAEVIKWVIINFKGLKLSRIYSLTRVALNYETVKVA